MFTSSTGVDCTVLVWKLNWWDTWVAVHIIIIGWYFLNIIGPKMEKIVEKLEISLVEKLETPIKSRSWNIWGGAPFPSQSCSWLVAAVDTRPPPPSWREQHWELQIFKKISCLFFWKKFLKRCFLNTCPMWKKLCWLNLAAWIQSWCWCWYSLTVLIILALTVPCMLRSRDYNAGPSVAVPRVSVGLASKLEPFWTFRAIFVELWLRSGVFTHFIKDSTITGAFL